jgi:hypothetical protein
MARDEAVVRVRLDTSQAKADLEALVKQSEGTSGRVGDNIRESLGRGLGIAAASGAAFGAGFSAIRAAATSDVGSGFGDITGEVFNSWGARLNEWLLGDIDDLARARTTSRNFMIENFAQTYQHHGKTEGMMNIFDSVTARELLREQGVSALKRDFPSDDLIEKMLERIVGAIRDGIRDVGRSLLGPLGGMLIK